MMRVVVIDDEPLARSGVAARLTGHDDVVVIGQYADAGSAFEGIVKERPDLAFVDVQMPGVSGLDLLAMLTADERPMAIMLTAYDSYAIRAFELRAIDYLLKPIDDTRFTEALDRARQAMPYRGRAVASTDMWLEEDTTLLERFAVRVGMKLVLVNVVDIDWIEADGDYAVLHVGEETHLVREPLHRLARRLDSKHFVRAHRSAIVRIDRIVEVKYLANRDALLRLRDGTPLRASRTYIGGLADALPGLARGHRR
ncbi:response regulator [Dyella sp. GSA-30]|uniref:LytR/AlgR family response regulator transcription factor n=1 Tax=Dyella sp. GSA-30 TaxID=2994496 RepID=UPI0024911350|nr:response regulator [Dyella sp. GSA-30]BDU19126.1 DNA-binding response regulator [Dyella sp. GSA-30]